MSLPQIAKFPPNSTFAAQAYSSAMKAANAAAFGEANDTAVQVYFEAMEAALENISVRAASEPSVHADDEAFVISPLDRMRVDRMRVPENVCTDLCQPYWGAMVKADFLFRDALNTLKAPLVGVMGGVESEVTESAFAHS